MPQKQKGPRWEARNLDDRRMRVEDFDPGRKFSTMQFHMNCVAEL